MNEEVVDAFARSAEPEYALAQQAEFEYLWLRELHRLTRAYMAVDGNNGTWDAMEFVPAKEAISNAIDVLARHLNPPTP